MSIEIDVDALAEKTRTDELAKVELKVASVRGLAAAAETASKLQTQADAATSEWAAAYERAVQSGLSEKDLSKLKPPAGSRAKRPRRAARASTSSTPAPDVTE